MREERPRFFFYHWKSLKSHNGIPYTHRRESENDTFQNMPKIFTGVENVFAGPGGAWKPHKWKDQIFLHRNYVQKKFSTPKKNLDPKKIEIFFGKKKSRKIFPKNPEFFIQKF